MAKRPSRGARMTRTIVAALATLLGAAAPVLAETGPAPAFVEGQCSPGQVGPDLAPRVRCGTVAVPRDDGHPERGTFALAVVVVASATQPARPDPDLYVSGGPGGPLTVYADAQARRPLAPGRDLVLVDQRGTGASEPALCPDLNTALVAAVATDPEAAAKRPATFAACRAEIVARGIDLADFGTTATVEDLDRVRRALGIARWNVFGVSYGTTVAMTMMALHPETIRTAVLDSVFPPDPILPPWSVNAADARDAFFAACEADQACHAAYPDLAGRYREVVERLARAPVAVAFPHGMGRPGDRGPLTPELFAFVVDRLVYYPTFYPGLPRLVAAARDGDTGPVAAAIATLFAAESDPRTGSRLSLRAAVDCRDRPGFHGAASPSDGLVEVTTLKGICDGWAPLGPPPLVPRDTAIPTLVLAGQFDPNARPADSRRVADMIGGHARWVEVMGLGHSVRAFSPCAAAMVAAFIDQPDQTLDTSCAAHAPPVRYLPSRPVR